MKSIIAADNNCLVVEVFTWQYLEVSTSIWLIISFQIMLKHFKMYIALTDIIGKKRIDLTYLIRARRLLLLACLVTTFNMSFRNLGQ